MTAKNYKKGIHTKGLTIRVPQDLKKRLSRSGLNASAICRDALERELEKNQERGQKRDIF